MYKKIKTKNTTIAAGLLLASIIINVIAVILSYYSATTLIDVLVFAPIAYFIFRGKKWAIVVAMILWTSEKIFQLFENPNLVKVTLIFWLVYMVAFYEALCEIKSESNLSTDTSNKKEDKNDLKILQNNNPSSFLKIGLIISVSISIILFGFYLYQRVRVSDCVVQSIKNKTVIPIEYVDEKCKDMNLADQVLCRYKQGINQDSYRRYCKDIYSMW